LPTTSKDVVTLNVDGTVFKFWETISFKRSLDTVDTLSFTTPFEYENKAFRDTFEPLSFKPLEVLVDDVLLFKGTMLKVAPQASSERKTATINGYALPGVLSDCTVAPDLFPLEFNNMDLMGITDTLISPFNLVSEFQSSTGAAFKRVAIKPTEKIMPFLVKLAQQRNFIISNTTDGALLFWNIITPGAPVARLKQGESPLISARDNTNPQEYYASITGFKPVKVGSSGGSQYTLENTFLQNVVRPFNFEVNDARGPDAKIATEAKMGRMFGNAINYSISVSTWRDPSGNLWEPNTTLKLTAPEALVYNETEFLIKSVSFSRTPETKIANMELVLTGSYTNEIPEVLPWA